MSEEVREYTEFKAPVTGWEVFLQGRYIVLVIVLVFILWVIWPFLPIPKNLLYGLTTFVSVFFLTGWYLGLPEGFALDSSDMSEGHIGLKPLNRFQLERLTGECMMFNSELGSIALVGHKLLSLDEEGVPTVHPQIELQTNSEIANRVASIQEDMFNEYLLLKRNSELHSMSKFAGGYKSWRKKARMDPEQERVIISSKQEVKSTD